MSQEFSFRNLLSGFLRLSSRQTVSDPEVLARFIHQITGDEYQYVPPPQAAAAAAASVQTAVSTPTAPAPAAVAVREKSQEIDRQMISEISFSAPPTSSTSINTITVAHTTGRVTNSKIKISPDKKGIYTRLKQQEVEEVSSYLFSHLSPCCNSSNLRRRQWLWQQRWRRCGGSGGGGGGVVVTVVGINVSISDGSVDARAVVAVITSA
jgi:hypothetical protein